MDVDIVVHMCLSVCVCVACVCVAATRAQLCLLSLSLSSCLFILAAAALASVRCDSIRFDLLGTTFKSLKFVVAPHHPPSLAPLPPYVPLLPPLSEAVELVWQCVAWQADKD